MSTADLRALQRHLAAARERIDAGDRAAALAEIDAALALDPHFVDAHACRKEATELFPAATESAGFDLDLNVQQPDGATAVQPDPTSLPDRTVPPGVSAEGWAQFEHRIRRRRVDRRLEVARAAIAGRRVAEAREALDEVRQLEPTHAQLALLGSQLNRLGPVPREVHAGARLTAVVAFGVVILAASWLGSPGSSPSYPVWENVPPTDGSRSAALPGEPVSGQVDELAPAVEVAPPLTLTTESAPSMDPTEEVSPLPPVAEPFVKPPQSEVSLGRTWRVPAPSAPVPPRVESPLENRSAVEDRASGESRRLPAVEAVLEPAGLPANALGVREAVDANEIVDDEALIKGTLQAYRSAYDGLDVLSAQKVWPAVDRLALARAFQNLESQRLTFEACDVRLQGPSANAVCRGTAQYVVKVGNRGTRVEPRVWNFTLRKTGEAWTIESARAARHD